MYSKYSTCSILAGLGLLASYPQVTLAEGESLDLEEVVVVAQKRETVLHKTPLAMSAFSGAYLERNRVERATDIGDRTPGFSYYSVSPLQANIAMRGSFTSDGSPGTDQPIALFLDEIYMGRPSDIDTDLFGLERIEVLRGPQGTLFGRNVVGGAISIFTKNPTEETEVAAALSVGNYSSREFKGYVSGGLSDDIFGSVTVKSSQADGWVTNIHTGNDAEGKDVQSFRGKLRLVPNDSLDIVFSTDYTKDRSDGLASFVHHGDAERFPNTPVGNKYSLESFDGGLIKDAWGLSLKVDWDVNFLGDDTTLTSITGYRKSDNLFFDSDVGPSIRQEVKVNLTDQDVDDRQFSQEIRLAGITGDLTWVAGVYYLDGYHSRKSTLDFQTLEGTSWSPGIGDGDAWADGGLRDVDFQGINVESTAVFSQFNYAFNDWLSMTVGGRYTKDKKSHHSWGMAGAFFFDVENFDVRGSKSWSKFTPKVGLEASFDNVGVFDSLFAFASYTEGFKSGGYNQQSGAGAITDTPVDPEFTESIEFGLRTRSFGNRLEASIVVFSQNTEGLQTQVFDNGQFFQDNAGETSVNGIELDLYAVLTEHFNIGLTYAYTDGEYDEFILKSLDFSGTTLPQTPETTYSIDASYVRPVGQGELSLSANFSHKSAIEITPRVASQAYPIRGDTERDTLNLTLSYEIGSWKVSAWGRNLTDDQPITSAFVSLSGLYLTQAEVDAGEQYWVGRVAAPRTYGITLAYEM